MGTSVALIHAAIKKCLGSTLGGPRRYLDFGAQNLYNSTADECRAFITYCRGSGALTPEIDRACEDIAARSSQDAKPYCAELFKLVGWEYMAIDMVEAADIKADLNVYQVATEHVAYFDFVANFGTTEHVFNQFPCFQSIHYATNPGGFMIHFLPVEGYLYHCFYRYDPKFFLLLAEANNYKVVHAGLYGERTKSVVDRRHASWAEYDTVAGESHRNIIAEFILQKHENTDFRAPYDLKGTDLDICLTFDPTCSALRGK